MAETVKTQILNNLIAAIQSIKKVDGYSRTVRTAERYQLNPEPVEFDAVFIEALREQKTDYANKVRHSDMTVTLACYVEDGAAIPEAVDQLSADVEKAICADPQRNTLAVDTNVISVMQFVTEDLEPTGTFIMEVEIQYRHVYGDPYTLVGA